MDGLDDRLGGLHKRLDDLDNRLDRHEMRLDAMPSSVGGPIKERIEGVERAVREQLDANARRRADEGLRKLLGETGTGLHQRLEDLAARPAVDPTEPLDGLASRLEDARRPAGRAGRAAGQARGRRRRRGWAPSAARSRRSSASSTRCWSGGRTAPRSAPLVARANEESERRNAGQLDEAMATFAELILGRGGVGASRRRPRPARPSAAAAARSR